MTRIKINEDEPISVSFTLRDRELIRDHTFSGSEIANPMAAAEACDGKLLVPFTLHDIEDLCGHVAAEANHTKDKQLRRELRELFARLSDLMEQYDDGNSQSIH